MLFWFFLSLASGSLLLMIALLIYAAFRPAVGSTVSVERSLLWLVVDYFSYHLPVWLNRFGRYFIDGSAFAWQRFLAVGRRWTSCLDRPFTRLNNTVQGRGERGQRGAASIFLSEIKRQIDEEKTR